jgi:hypothetical protein
VNIVSGVAVVVAGFIWILVVGMFAYRDGMLTPHQMVLKHPSQPRGLPFIWHGGMWADMFILTPIIGFIVMKYGDSWSVGQWGSMLALWLVFSIVMFWTYILNKTPDCLAWSAGISIAGRLHFLYIVGICFLTLGLRLGWSLRFLLG